MALPLQAQIKHYDWGVPGALSEALGRTPSGAPEAEIWWGNHPLAECAILSSDGAEDFPHWLEATGTNFRLLVKLLAAQKPLSIQVHPSENQARRGFDREQAEGLPLDARERTYKDRSAKPELIIALSAEFVGLVGFASETAVRERLARWVAAGAPQALAALMDSVASGPREAARLITDESADHSHVVHEIDAWLGRVNPIGLESTTSHEVRLLQQVAAAHPGDVGILFALLMHHVHLERGEALFVAAGEVHAYVHGLGLEVMLPSDNVIRAGLTSKHKDIEAFLELSTFAPTTSPTLVRPHSELFGQAYQGFGAGFTVHRISCGHDSFTVARPSVCFVESGEALIGNAGATRFSKGAAVFALPGETVAALPEDGVVWAVQSTED